MASVNAFYARGHGDAPVVVETAADADALINRVRRESAVAAPILIEMHVAGDPYGQGLDVGVAGDRGVLRYSGREWPEGVYSAAAARGAQPDGEAGVAAGPVLYFYMDAETEFPATAEVPVEVVAQAVKEFLATGGARPRSVRWQAEPSRLR